jgi:hypothetical protein
MPNIKITFTKTGQTKIEVNGVAGESCLKLSEAYEQALSRNSLRQQEFKDDYYQYDPEQLRQNQVNQNILDQSA